jgi:hypothetical protein
MQHAKTNKAALTPNNIISVTVKWNVLDVMGSEMDEIGSSSSFWSSDWNLSKRLENIGFLIGGLRKNEKNSPDWKT